MIKFFNYILLAICLIIMFSTTAFAYLDPSVMTYTIQMVAGIIIAISAVIGIYWRNAKRKIQNKLGIDKDAKKEIEDDVIEFISDSDEK